MKAADGLKQRHQEERESQFQNKQEVGFLLVIHEHVVHGVCMCVEQLIEANCMNGALLS